MNSVLLSSHNPQTIGIGHHHTFPSKCLDLLLIITMRLELLTITGALFGDAWGCTFFNVAGACTWRGTGPTCGGVDDDIRNHTEFALHDHHPTMGYLMWWSVGDNVCKRLCSLERAAFPYMGSCCPAFGNGCVTGYKRLWCQTWPGAPPTPSPSTRPSLPRCHGLDDQDQQLWNQTDNSHHMVD